MIDPITGAALINAGASIIGGMMAPTERDQRRSQEKLQREMDLKRPKWIRKGAEAAGFNPLVFAGPTGAAASLPALGNPMGDAISRAGAAVADGFGQAAQLDMQQAELDVERERLELLREELKLKPKVPGIYGSPAARPASYFPNSPSSGGPTGFIPAAPGPRRPVGGYAYAGQEGGPGPSQMGGGPNDYDVEDPGTDFAKTGHGPLTYNENIAPRFSMFGINWRGSGRFSSGQTLEDSWGDTPWNWVYPPLAAADAVGYTAGAAMEEHKDAKLFDEWVYRERYKIPVGTPLPKGWRSMKSPAELDTPAGQAARASELASTVPPWMNLPQDIDTSPAPLGVWEGFFSNPWLSNNAYNR